MKTGAIILAAGHHSSDCEFQPMLKIGDTSAVKRIIITLSQAGISPIVVITGKNADELEKHISKMRVICLRNKAFETTQMFESICIGLSYIKNLCDRVLILPVKVPMFQANTIEQLQRSNALFASPVYKGQKGHPVLIAAKMAEHILSYSGTYGLSGFLEQEEVRVMVEQIPVEDQGIIFPVETKQDCEQAMESLAQRSIPMHSKVSVYLECGEVFFGPGIAQLLELIANSGSIQTACRQMHMSYTKGWKIIKTAQEELGFPLLVTKSGGSVGGFSHLTKRAQDFLEKYLKMEQELKLESERLFFRYFKEE